MHSTLRRLKAPLALLSVALLLAGAPAPRLHAQETSKQVSGADSTPEANTPAKEKQEEDENDAYRKSPTVRALGATLGMNPDQAATAFTVLNFVILAIAVLYGLAKMLPAKFRERNTAIQKHLVDARTATEEASARLSSVEERLKRLDGEIAAMKTQAEADSLRDEERIKASVEEESKKILAGAEQEIHAATQFARRELQKYAAELAIDQAAQRLTVTAETDRLLVQGFAQRLLDESKGGQN